MVARREDARLPVEPGRQLGCLASAGGSGEPLNRTSSCTGADQFPSFSPDGGQIAFWSDREGAGYFVMPTLAGAARKVAAAEGLVGPLTGRATALS